MKIKKLLGGLIAMATLATCAFGAVGCSKDSAQGAPIEQTQAGGMGVTEGKSNGVSLMATTIEQEDYAEYGVVATAESAFQITATITPAYAINQKVDWSLSYKDPTSQYVVGKTNVTEVTVTPTNDGALTAIVACLSGFGEPIIVTVTSRANTSVKAICQCDYVRKVDGIESVTLLGESSSQTITDGVFVNTMSLGVPDYRGDEGMFQVFFNDLSTVWTIGDDYDCSIFLEFKRDFAYALQDQGFTVRGNAIIGGGLEYIHNLAANIIELIEDADEQDLATYGKCDLRSFEEGEYDEALYAAFAEFGEGTEIGRITFTVQFEDDVIEEVSSTFIIVVGADCINASA